MSGEESKFVSEKTGSENQESISGRDVNKSEDELVSSGRSDSINVTETNLRFKNDFFKKVFESQERLTSLADLFTGDSLEHIELMNVIPIVFGSKENHLSFLCIHMYYYMLEQQMLSHKSDNICYPVKFAHQVKVYKADKMAV